MNWNKIEANQEAICKAVALQIDQPVTAVVRDTVRDTIYALKEGKVKEFGGLEHIAAVTIQMSDALDTFGATKPEPEPEAAPKPKRGKQ